MSEDKFLRRWSRRKQEAKASATPPETVTHEDVRSAPPPAVRNKDVEFDLSDLPPLDSITSATDIKAFLHKGIPQELMRAALRRAWSADPAIRDFVGLAENAWDFNDPTAMPGFGPLDCSAGELAELVDRIVGGLGKTAQSLPDLTVESEDSSRELHQEEVAEIACAVEGTAVSAPVAAQPVATDHAGVQDTQKKETVPMRRRGMHGGALPF
ncbi:DUF3306 domain-containing protein [Bradyrhizobium sp. STM 3557]|uniref:DUF3306 domain-containing protein n=1 Tax=Bradyrhizobium sp. STM 3557 TaxID=578920 RepID=UPI0038900866